MVSQVPSGRGAKFPLSRQPAVRGKLETGGQGVSGLRKRPLRQIHHSTYRWIPLDLSLRLNCRRMVYSAPVGFRVLWIRQK